MGSMLGKISEETPKFRLVRKYADFELRHYDPRVVSEITFFPAEGENAGTLSPTPTSANPSV